MPYLPEDPTSSSDETAFDATSGDKHDPSIIGVPRKKQSETKEIGGPSGPEPTRYGDWERKGRCVDF